MVADGTDVLGRPLSKSTTAAARDVLSALAYRFRVDSFMESRMKGRGRVRSRVLGVSFREG